jgi:hypothetical protein
MFDQLDVTLFKLLNQAPSVGALKELHDAEISFYTPERGYKPQSSYEVNLFLNEVRENRALRDSFPSVKHENWVGARKRAPIRVDCVYMVTAWAEGKNKNDIVADSHKLLGQAFNWLSRFPVIPEALLKAGGLSGQLYAPPTMVAQMDGAKSAGEFWTALGIPPRPYFNLIVTICMDLDQAIEDSIVTTMSSNYLQADSPSCSEERLIIGGTVMDATGKPLPDAWVRLEPINTAEVSSIQVTDHAGHFIFDKVAQGSGFTLRARANGYPEIERTFDVVPSVSGDYDLHFNKS